jgi:ribosomal protein L37AE/L43A
MNTCPCCSEILLRHARQGNIYWFCTHCRQEMPGPSLERIGVRQLLVRLPELASLVSTQ